jgi:DNA-binding MarR family transcriptional regulator
LERRGLVKVSPDPGDRRSRRVALTAQGQKLLGRAVPVWERVHRELEGLLPEGDPDRLRNNLHALS